MALISHRRLTRVIAPVRVHMHTHEIHPPSRRKQLVDHGLVMSETAGHIIIVPCIIIEERTVGLSESVKDHDIARLIHKIPSRHPYAMVLRLGFRLGFRFWLRLRGNHRRFRLRLGFRNDFRSA